MILKFYCKRKEPDFTLIQWFNVLQTFMVLMLALHVELSWFVLVISGFKWLKTYIIVRSISVFNLMRQQKDFMLRKHFFIRCMITKKKYVRNHVSFRIYEKLFSEVTLTVKFQQSFSWFNLWISGFIIGQLTHLPTDRQEFYYPAGRQPGAMTLAQN